MSRVVPECPGLSRSVPKLSKNGPKTGLAHDAREVGLASSFAADWPSCATNIHATRRNASALPAYCHTIVPSCPGLSRKCLKLCLVYYARPDTDADTDADADADASRCRAPPASSSFFSGPDRIGANRLSRTYPLPAVWVAAVWRRGSVRSAAGRSASVRSAAGRWRSVPSAADSCRNPLTFYSECGIVWSESRQEWEHRRDTWTRRRSSDG